MRGLVAALLSQKLAKSAASRNEFATPVGSGNVGGTHQFS
jgi:hypothetical protein